MLNLSQDPVTTTSIIEVFKYPRGFIKIFQAVFSIVTFTIMWNFVGSYGIEVRCHHEGGQIDTFNATIVYPFKVDNVLNRARFCEYEHSYFYLQGDSSYQAHAYVFTGCFAGGYALLVSLIYMFKAADYGANDWYPKVDFILTVLISLFWLGASSGWAHGINDFSEKIQLKDVLYEIYACREDMSRCFVNVGSFFWLQVAIYLGFVNIILWVYNSWIIYKETPYFNKRAMYEEPDGSTSLVR